MPDAAVADRLLDPRRENRHQAASSSAHQCSLDVRERVDRTLVGRLRVSFRYESIKYCCHTTEAPLTPQLRGPSRVCACELCVQSRVEVLQYDK